jgi:hemerythrin-like domain-containing protein
MVPVPTSRRITGPLKTWYDMHEALRHEVTALADQAAELTADGVAAFAQRFGALDGELRTHSRVEDAVMFPAVAARGGIVAAKLFTEHREEQLRTYELGAAVMGAKTNGDRDSLSQLATLSAGLRDSLLAHLQLEDDDVLGQVDELFRPDEQAEILRKIVASMPADPTLQPWVASALTPEHLAARLQNMASSLDRAGLVGVLTQIHDGVDAEIWAQVEARTPDLAALVATD